jgi:hypothetical protein
MNNIQCWPCMFSVKILWNFHNDVLFRSNWCCYFNPYATNVQCCFIFDFLIKWRDFQSVSEQFLNNFILGFLEFCLQLYWKNNQLNKNLEKINILSRNLGILKILKNSFKIFGNNFFLNKWNSIEIFN